MSKNISKLTNEELVELAKDTYGNAVRDNTRDQLISIGLDIEVDTQEDANE